MKEATGELNMTVITLIAIAAIGALFYFFVWPMIQQMIANNTCRTYGPSYSAVYTSTNSATGSQATVKVWKCCPGGKEGEGSNCIVIDDENAEQTEPAN